MTFRPLYLTLLASLAVQGCATKPTITAAEDPTDPMNDGRATTCTAAPVANGAGAITMSSDGWCSVATADSGGPFLYGRVTSRPANGRVEVRTVGRETRIEYHPVGRPAASDSFTVALRPRSSNTDVPVRVAVSVTGAEATAVSAPAAVSTPPAATTRRPAARPSTPARRSNNR